MHLIACEVFRPELERLTRAMRNAPEVTYLEQGLHDTPDELRRRVQQAVDALEAKGRNGHFPRLRPVRARAYRRDRAHRDSDPPRVHDCIPVLLGATQEQANESSLGGGTYWLSPAGSATRKPRSSKTARSASRNTRNGSAPIPRPTSSNSKDRGSETIPTPA
ncbi:MAG: hypothetical protein ACLRWP_15500 [Bilophila wadsworthia]